MGLIHHAIKGVAHHILGEEVEKRALTAREEVRIYLYLQFRLPHFTPHYIGSVSAIIFYFDSKGSTMYFVLLPP